MAVLRRIGVKSLARALGSLLFVWSLLLTIIQMIVFVSLRSANPALLQSMLPANVSVSQMTVAGLFFESFVSYLLWSVFVLLVLMLFAWLFNFFAPRFGGLEVEFEGDLKKRPKF